MQGLVRIAEMPQGGGEPGEAKHLAMGCAEVARGTGLLGYVKGETLLQMRAGSIQFPTQEQDIPKHDMGIPEACRVMDTLGQAEYLLRQLPRGLELYPHGIER